MPKLYTTTGDDGYTSLLGEGRVPKYTSQLEAVGNLDEATAALGMARTLCKAPHTAQLILEVQRDLYNMMTEVAARPEIAARFRKIDSQRVIWLEDQIGVTSKQTAIPQEFILPGDTPAGAALAMARTVIRRAERRMAQLFHERVLENKELLRYLNRLSSFCFALEVLENQAAGVETSTLAKPSLTP